MLLFDKKALAAFRQNKIALVGLGMLVIIVGTALFADFIAPFDVRDQHVKDRYQPPSMEHFMGTDEFGRDVFSRVVVGSRISMMVGIISISLAMVAGVLLGAYAGFKGGWIDQVLTKVIDALMTFPSLILGILVVSALGPGERNAVIAIAIAFVPRFARVARGPSIVLRENEFIMASRACGATDFRVLFVHILPNLVGEVVVMGSLWVSTAIIIEASLSFLGLGVQPPTPSWGMMIKAGVEEIQMAPWLAIFPGLAISFAVLAFNLLGDGLRDLLDPKLLK
ncbi:ABC transporter permease [Desulfospira joergensenii]|uniref:ABC transporter permease n=1 Tax=Desulfospira joergensenii TaxID=53329 RepID=UPI0003B3FAF3|nr:ABC transporter permease [Desulfospira joergensenii]